MHKIPRRAIPRSLACSVISPIMDQRFTGITTAARLRDRQRPRGESLSDRLDGRHRCGRMSRKVAQGLRVRVRYGGGMEDRVAVGRSEGDTVEDLDVKVPYGR